jgi:quercetin dioxygenase-like cupin family protein
MKVYTWENLELETVTPEISRKIISGENEMIAKIFLNKGAVVPEHSHISEQITYVVKGALKFWIGGEEIILEAGQVMVIPPNMPHKAQALEDTEDVDVFSPIRQDWLDHTDTYFHRKE